MLTPASEDWNLGYVADTSFMRELYGQGNGLNYDTISCQKN